MKLTNYDGTEASQKAYNIQESINLIRNETIPTLQRNEYNLTDEENAERIYVQHKSSPAPRLKTHHYDKLPAGAPTARLTSRRQTIGHAIALVFPLAHSRRGGARRDDGV